MECKMWVRIARQICRPYFLFLDCVDQETFLHFAETRGKHGEVVVAKISEFVPLYSRHLFMHCLSTVERVEPLDVFYKWAHAACSGRYENITLPKHNISARLSRTGWNLHTSHNRMPQTRINEKRHLFGRTTSIAGTLVNKKSPTIHIYTCSISNDDF